MKQSLIYLIAGARPNFMKIAPIIHALQAGRSGSLGVSFTPANITTGR